MPTDESIMYTVYSEKNFMIEQTLKSSFLTRVNNTVIGDLETNRTFVLPSDFR